MALQGEAHLYDAPPQQDESHGTNQSEDKVAEIVYNLQWVIGGKSRAGQANDESNGQNSSVIELKALFYHARHGQLIGVLTF